MYKFEVNQSVQINCPDNPLHDTVAVVRVRETMILPSVQDGNVFDKIVNIYKLNTNSEDEKWDNVFWNEPLLEIPHSISELADWLISEFGDNAYRHIVELTVLATRCKSTNLAHDYAEAAKILIQKGYHKKGNSNG